MVKKLRYVQGKILTLYYGRQLQFFRCVSELCDHAIHLTLSLPKLIHHVFDVLGVRSYLFEVLLKIVNTNLKIKYVALLRYFIKTTWLSMIYLVNLINLNKNILLKQYQIYFPIYSNSIFLQVLTQEDWNLVLFLGMERTSHWAALYFVALMTFGNYVLFNLLVAILVEGFSNQVREHKTIFIFVLSSS